MPLEPTEEQVAAMVSALGCAPWAEATPKFEMRLTSIAMWHVIAPMVLEAAARECELPQAQDDWVPEIAQQCARDIRAMKGTP